MTIIYFIITGIGALIAFIVLWFVAEVLIPLIDHLSKKRYFFLTIKFSMTAMAAFAPMVIYTFSSE